MSQDRFDINFDHSDVTKPAQPRRGEVITGFERRRRWSRDVKMRIVAESLAEGVIASHVAHRHRISPQQLFGWRSQLRGEIEAADPVTVPAFAPAIVDDAASKTSPVALPRPNSTSQPCIEIAIGRVVVRVHGGVNGEALADVLKAVRLLA